MDLHPVVKGDIVPSINVQYNAMFWLHFIFLKGPE